jgi:hypothetical protein
MQLHLLTCGFYKDILIDERYRIDYKIGEGGFGLVYAEPVVVGRLFNSCHDKLSLRDS